MQNQINVMCWKGRHRSSMRYCMNGRRIWHIMTSSRDESRLAFRELAETSQLAFMNCFQTRDEKIEEWAERVLRLATNAYMNLPDEHEQSVMRFCHGGFDKKCGDVRSKQNV